ncbi:membrane protein [Lactiplantibacillus plantarum subsp. plantarum]|nr:membrane protein [Lactiplantibacillus plantarum subsp. plantarum]
MEVHFDYITACHIHAHCGLAQLLSADAPVPTISLFDPNKAPTIKHVARYGGGLMLLVTIACFVTIFVQATMLIAIVLASGSLIMMAIALILVSFMQIS